MAAIRRWMGAHELLRYRAREYTIRVGGETWREEALVILCANGRQYGGGAVVAPTARLDDAQLDLVVVAPRAPLLALRDSLHLFRGTLDRAPGVRTARAPTIEVAGREPLLFHVDGEAVAGGPTIAIHIRPAVLRVRVP